MGGGLNGSPQHFILNGEMEVLRWLEGFVEVLRRQRERRCGSLAAGGVAEIDRPRVRQGVLVYSFPAFAARWDPAGIASSLSVGPDVDRARDDIAWACGRTIGAFDVQTVGPRAVDGEP